MLPDVPSIAESGYPGYSHVTWIGILAPAGTPSAIVARLNREVATILANDATRARIVTTGAEPVGGSRADFEAMLKSEYEVMAALMPRLGIKID
jgi:tripartite-type tricarboxylate transporter receptor subunit TctC